MSSPQFLVIKNMVCPRCIETVNRAAKSAGLQPSTVELGKIQLGGAPDKSQLKKFREEIEAHGFEILESGKVREVNQIKSLIIERIHYHKGNSDLKLSACLAQGLGSDYSRLSKLFSSVEGITIERFATLQRIEKVKELLIYDQLNLSEIADLLDYSSPSHLSHQFKRETGMAPSTYKRMRTPNRKSLDSI